MHELTINEALYKIRLMQIDLIGLEKFLISAESISGNSLKNNTQRSPITATILEIIDGSKNGITSRDLKDLIASRMQVGAGSVQTALSRQFTLGRIKRVNGLWRNITAPGTPDIIPQRVRQPWAITPQTL